MPRKSRTTGELTRSYNQVRRVVGPLFVCAGRLVVVGVPRQRSHEFLPLEFAAALFQDQIAPAETWRRALGGREVFEIDPGRLGRLHYHYKRLSNAYAIGDALDHGAFKSMKRDELSRQLHAIGARLDVLSRLLTDLPAWLSDSPDPTVVDLFASHVVSAVRAQPGTSDGLDSRTQLAVRRCELLVPERATGLRTMLPRDADEPPDEEMLVRRFAIALQVGEAAPAIPHDWGRPTVDRVLDALCRLPSKRAAEAWQNLVALTPEQLEHLNVYWLESWMRPDSIRRAIEQGLTDCLWRFEDQRSLNAYLDACDKLRDTPAHHETSRDWFIELFTSGAAWGPTLVLTLLLSAGRGSDSTMELHGVAKAIGGPHGLRLAEALSEWSEGQVRARPRRYQALGEALDCTTSSLDQYLIYRRIAGHGETFSKGLLEPLDLAAKEAGEIDALSARLSEGPNPALRARLDALRDPERANQRQQAARARARKRLERALDRLRVESFDALMDEASRTLLRQLLGAPVPPQPLPDNLSTAIHLLHASNIDHKLLRRFLLDVLAGAPVDQSKVNADWRRKAEHAGVDVARWTSGIDQTVVVAGNPVRIHTEHDPLEAVLMGSHFSTCLNLESGENAASTLVNVLDANKQVVYARRADGSVVGRKLIGLNERMELVGFHDYAHEHREELAQASHDLLGTFAAEVGVQLAAAGVPAVLHDSFWYDDGLVPWGTLAKAELDPPPDGPADAEAAREYAYVRAVRGRDADALRRLADAEEGVWSDAAWAELCTLSPSQIDSLPSTPERRALAGARGEFGWLGKGRSHAGLHTQLVEAAGVVGFAEDCVRALLDASTKTLLAARVRRNDHWDGMLPLPAPFGLLTPAEVVRFLSTYVELLRRQEQECVVQEHEDCIETWVSRAAALLEIVVSRRGDARALVELVDHSDPLLAAIAVVVLSRRPIAGAAPPLRKRLRRPRGLSITNVALALGTQAEPGDAWALLSAFRRAPSMDLALAVRRTADVDASAEVVSTMLDALSLEELVDHGSVACRELFAGEKLARLEPLFETALADARDAVRRSQGPHAWPFGGDAVLWLANLALEDGDPAVWIDRMKKSLGNSAPAVSGYAKLWRQARDLSAANSPEDALGVLSQQYSLAWDHRTRRGVIDLAVGGADDETRSRALRVWSHQETVHASTLNLAAVGARLRASAVRAATGHNQGEAPLANFAWLERLDEGDNAAVRGLWQRLGSTWAALPWAFSRGTSSQLAPDVREAAVRLAESASESTVAVASALMAATPTPETETLVRGLLETAFRRRSERKLPWQAIQSAFDRSYGVVESYRFQAILIDALRPLARAELRRIVDHSTASPERRGWLLSRVAND